MKGKQILVGLVLVASLILGAGAACAPAAPGVAPTYTYIDIGAGRPQSPWFPIGHGVATFVNEDSDWLRASTLATAGLTDSVRLTILDPDRRANTMGFSAPIIKLEFPPEVQQGAEQRWIVTTDLVPQPIVTLDPNIKTVFDLEGKTMGVPRRAAAHWNIVEEFFNVTGLMGKVELFHGGFEAVMGAIRDGAAEAGILNIDLIWPEEYALGSNIEQLKMRGDIYWVDMSYEHLAQACYNLGVLPQAMTIPANSLPNQPQAFTALQYPHFLYADTAMDEDIVYEVTRIVWAHAGEFERFHFLGKNMNENFIRRSDATTDAERQASYHPGAYRFFKDQGIELKSFTED